jgi:hypothetical protein
MTQVVMNILYFLTTTHTIYNQGLETGLTRETTEHRNQSQSIEMTDVFYKPN